MTATITDRQRTFVPPIRRMHMKHIFFYLILTLTTLVVQAQSFKISGKVLDPKGEPLAFASIQVKDQQGYISKEDGSFEMNLAPGQYNLVVSMIGYKTQVISLFLDKNLPLTVTMEENDKSDLEDIVIRVKAKDRSEEIMRNVVRNKDALTARVGPYSAKLYSKAVQEDSTGRRRDRAGDSSQWGANIDLRGMSMTEVLLRLDYESDNRIREQRLGVKESGDPKNLFYLSATQGNFSFFNNLVKVPAISQTPFISPFSYSGLLAYRFKALKTERVNGRRIFTIQVRPRQLSNATVEGEVKIEDSSWAVLQTRFVFPSYHLPEYDYFEVKQNYIKAADSAWVLGRQEFDYYSKAGRRKLSGETVVVYSDYELQKKFGRNYFGTEVSATAQSAYEQDSTFWNLVRAVPLNDREVRFIHLQDSLYRLTNSPRYLDSIDRVNNRITWKKMALFGQSVYNRQKERTIIFPALISLYAPFQFGGGRLNPSFYLFKRYPNRKDITVFADLSYGFRNKDLNGSLKLKRMYNPFNRGYYMVELNRDFDQIYTGESPLNQIKRTSFFLNNYVAAGHGLEVANGLNVYTEIDYAFRRSLVGYKLGAGLPDIIKKWTKDTASGPGEVTDFIPFQGTYVKLQLRYTPGQKYMREPLEKVILGSKWPTFYASYRKGIPDVLKSEVNFDYLELGIEQQIKLGVMGNLRYNVKTGDFITQKSLKELDYTWQRQGDPLIFMNPDESFQMLDSTLPLFKRFYQTHIVHEFNGALINKIPLLKKLQLREVAGGGVLVAPEYDLRYAELFGGVERIFKWPFNPLTRFKVGVYVVGSWANQFKNPIQFKLGITTWDKRKNKWR